MAERNARDTILVVLQLAGGNDGLNTVVPYEDDRYVEARPTLRLAAGGLHKIADGLGLHAEMKGFARLLQEGLLSVVQGVGYPNPHGGHFESMHVWQTASLPGTPSQTGWIGRAVDEVYRPDEARVPAVYVGKIDRPFALNAEKAVVPTVSALDDASFPTPGAEAQRPRRDQVARVSQPGEAPLLDFMRRSALAAHATHRQLEAVGRSSSSSADYPAFQLAEMLRIVAGLIRAELGIRIFFSELGGQEPGGFDTHAGQAANHGALLRQLSESVSAFTHDLKRDGLLDRVVLMTFSEFGRTLAENGRRGTDHGSAAPVFLTGGRLKGGLRRGASPPRRVGGRRPQAPHRLPPTLRHVARPVAGLRQPNHPRSTIRSRRVAPKLVG